MFSLQAHNQQILFHLSQITPRRHTIRLKETRLSAKDAKKSQPNNQSETLSTLELNKLCADSLNEAMNNFKLSENCAMLTLPLSDIVKSHRATKQHLEKNLISLESQLNRSYVSNDSFTQNKAEPIDNRSKFSPNNFLLVSNLLGQLSQPQFMQQTRGFKTVRSIEAQTKRNPSFASRFEVLFSKSNAFPFKSIDNNETLNKLLQTETNSTLTGDSKQNIKIAFAEGYLAAKHTDDEKSGFASKLLKFLVTVSLFAIFPIILIMSMGGNGPINVSLQKSRLQLGGPNEVNPEDISVTFDDVKGCDEAKQELQEIVEFLRNPDKFSTLGGKLPKGALLVGPPGTGKTLLARAVAGEAGVPFFHAAGAEFDEVLVGQGARRVRDLFKAAKERAPCVIFIDEIDSVGGKRSTSVLHPYANQTINQLLSEMDGFHQNEGVIVLGATNRRDDLDSALLRPGRFDVEVNVPVPDFTGRQEIISLYLQKIRHKDINVETLARGTTGFTGAELENMTNQAALRAAIDGDEFVKMHHIEAARDKIMMGPERKSRLPDEEANKITAYHEAGHTIVGFYTQDANPVHKVTIMPRGPALGHTAYLPKKEHYHLTKAQLLAMMDTAMGGRAAEEIIFGADKVTAGASNDFKHATSIAHKMVKELGMSEKVGFRRIEEPGAMQSGETLGPNTIELIDSEIKRILNESYERAKTILVTHSKEHKALAEALLKYETLDAEDIKTILNGGVRR